MWINLCFSRLFEFGASNVLFLVGKKDEIIGTSITFNFIQM